MTTNLRVQAAFSQPVTGDVFTLDDPVAGLLDNLVYGLGDDTTDIAGDVFAVSISRGRQSQVTEVIDPGTVTVSLRNQTRKYDPTYVSSPYYGSIVPSVVMDVFVDDVQIFGGRVLDWNFDYEVDGQSTALAMLIDGLGVLGGAEFNDWTATPGELTGARLGAILDRPEVLWGAARDLDAGNTTLQGDSVTWGSNVLNYAQLVTQSELGYLYASRDNVITFQDRYTGFNATTPAVSFTDTSPGVFFAGIVTSYGSELLYNRVGVDPEGLTKQTVTDTASAALYGWKSLSLSGLLMDSEAQALDMATYLASIYASPQFRIEAVTVYLHDTWITLAERQQILALDISSIVSVSYTPNRLGSAITQSLVIQGIEHNIDSVTHTVTFYLYATSSAPFLTLDDDVYGLLDGDNGLAF